MRYLYMLGAAALLGILMMLPTGPTPDAETYYCVDDVSALSCYLHGDVPPDAEVVWVGPREDVPGALEARATKPEPIHTVNPEPVEATPIHTVKPEPKPDPFADCPELREHYGPLPETPHAGFSPCLTEPSLLEPVTPIEGEGHE